jgi:hypothetical protein
MRNTVFMVNQAFCEDTFDGVIKEQLKKGLDELLIVKLWKKGATTEVRTGQGWSSSDKTFDPR